MNLSPAHKREKLRQLINGQDAVVAPGIYDAFGAKLVTNAGFSAVYLTGNGVSASLLGHPDIGQVDLTLIADHARRIAACTHLPLICDADTGYGGLFNIQRTVQEFILKINASLNVVHNLKVREQYWISKKLLIKLKQLP